MYIAQFTDLYQNRELPRFKKENPGLRLSQLKELIYKAFQKSPENPFNQQNVLAYNATTEDVRSLKGIYLEWWIVCVRERERNADILLK